VAVEDLEIVSCHDPPLILLTSSISPVGLTVNEQAFVLSARLISCWSQEADDGSHRARSTIGYAFVAGVVVCRVSFQSSRNLCAGKEEFAHGVRQCRLQQRNTHRVALARGFFKAQGIQIEPILIRGGPAAIAALTSGEVDFASIGGAQAVFRSNSRGLDLYIIGSISNTTNYVLLGNKQTRTIEDL